MVLALQGSLLDQGPVPTVAGFTDALHRNELSAGAWIEHLPGWILGSDHVFQSLVNEVRWRRESRQMYDRVVKVPRLVAWYAVHELTPFPILLEAAAALSDHYGAETGEPFASAGMCLYRDGRDSVAWHGDTIGRGATTDTTVAIVSFGSPRTLRLRPRAGGPGRNYTLGHGDLFVMGGSCQRTWEHSVPKTATAVGPRVSVQYRLAGVA